MFFGGLTETSEEAEERGRPYGAIMMERITGSEDGRIDHVLQVCILFGLNGNELPFVCLLYILFKILRMQNKTFEHQYISAVGAHT